MTALEARKIIEDDIAQAKGLCTKENKDKLRTLRDSVVKDWSELLGLLENSYHGSDEIKNAIKSRKNEIQSFIKSTTPSLSDPWNFDDEKRKRYNEEVSRFMAILHYDSTIFKENQPLFELIKTVAEKGKKEHSSYSFNDTQVEAAYNLFIVKFNACMDFNKNITLADERLAVDEKMLNGRIHTVSMNIAPSQVQEYIDKANAKIAELNNKIAFGQYKDEKEVTETVNEISKLQRQIDFLKTYCQRLANSSPTRTIEESADWGKKFLDIIGVVVEGDTTVLSREVIDQAKGAYPNQIASTGARIDEVTEQIKAESGRNLELSKARTNTIKRLDALNAEATAIPAVIDLLAIANESNKAMSPFLEIEAQLRALNNEEVGIKNELNEKNDELKQVEERLNTLMGRFNGKDKKTRDDLKDAITKLNERKTAIATQRTVINPDDEYIRGLDAERKRMSEDPDLREKSGKVWNSFDSCERVFKSAIKSSLSGRNLGEAELNNSADVCWDKVEKFMSRRNSGTLTLSCNGVSVPIEDVIGSLRQAQIKNATDIASEQQTLATSDSELSESSGHYDDYTSRRDEMTQILNTQKANQQYLESTPLTQEKIDELNRNLERQRLMDALNSGEVTEEELEAARGQINSDIEEGIKRL